MGVEPTYVGYEPTVEPIHRNLRYFLLVASGGAAPLFVLLPTHHIVIHGSICFQIFYTEYSLVLTLTQITFKHPHRFEL